MMKKDLNFLKKITNLDDYYPTRSELEILDQKSTFKKTFLKEHLLLNLVVGQIKK